MNSHIKLFFEESVSSISNCNLDNCDEGNLTNLSERFDVSGTKTLKFSSLKTC